MNITGRLWVFTVALLAATVLLAGCSGLEPAQPGKTVAPVQELPNTFKGETPEYGGEIAFAVGQIGGFDPSNATALSPSVLLVYEGLVAEDWTRGPTGAGLTDLSSNYTSPEYFMGSLAESWKISDPMNITFYLRRGVHFQNKPPVNGRELTADDVVASIEHYKASPRSAWYTSQTLVKALSQYAVQFSLLDPNPFILLTGYNNTYILPREVVFTDLTDWHNMNTTGAYFVDDVVSDSSISYARNKDHWQTDPFRPGNKLPYIDSLQALVMTDTNLQLAAFKSGRIGRLALTKGQADATLKQFPSLKSRRLPPTLTNIIHMRTDVKTGPYSNVLVRQALSMAIDRQKISDELYGGDAVLLNWPFQTTAGPMLYTPLDSLPSNLKELYEYHPDKSRQLLAEAGYAKGFSASLSVLPDYAGGIEMYTYVKDYFDAIGVKTTIISANPATYFNSLIRHTYVDMSTSAWGNSHPVGAVGANSAGYAYNYSAVNDQYVEDERKGIYAMPDDNERFARLKELGLYLIEQQYYIELPSPYTYILWQPWLKGQSGEVIYGSLNNYFGYLQFSWVDSKMRSDSSSR